MNLRSRLPTIAAVAVAVALSGAGFAQIPEALDPRTTEVWEPGVPDIKPGPFRPSPPPRGAVILLGDNGIDEWEAMDGSPAGWSLAGDILTVVKRKGSIRTRRQFTDYTLHLEWRTPANITGKGQARGNSGLFLGSIGKGDEGYELQILDSYRNRTYANGQAGAIYKQQQPLANPIRPPGEWNSYDVKWTAPRFAGDGSLVSPARVTARMNGVLVQRNFALKGETRFIGQPAYRAHGPLPIMLQAHGDPSEPIAFRNIWLVERNR